MRYPSFSPRVVFPKRTRPRPRAGSPAVRRRERARVSPLALPSTPVAARARARVCASPDARPPSRNVCPAVPSGVPSGVGWRGLSPTTPSPALRPWTRTPSSTRSVRRARRGRRRGRGARGAGARGGGARLAVRLRGRGGSALAASPFARVRGSRSRASWSNAGVYIDVSKTRPLGCPPRMRSPYPPRFERELRELRRFLAGTGGGGWRDSRAAVVVARRRRV